MGRPATKLASEKVEKVSGCSSSEGQNIYH